MDRIQAMTAFVAVAELRGFVSAARRLRVSPSVVTRQVAALEEHLGLRLLQRTTRSVSITDAGARYLESARRILAAVDEAERGARAERAEPHGRLVVTAPNVFGRLEVAPLLCDFLARHPAVLAELVLADRVVNLVDEGVDVAVRIGALADSGLHARVVGRTRRVLVASPGYIAAHRRPRSPAQLAGHALIHFTGIGGAAEWRFGAGGDEVRVPIAPRLVSNSADAVVGHAERGGGIAMVLAYQVKEALARGALEILLPRHEPPPLPIQLVYPSSRLLSANVKAFIELAATRKWDF